MKPLPEDTGTLFPTHELPDTGTLVSTMLDLGTMVINSDTDTEATMKSVFNCDGLYWDVTVIIFVSISRA